MKDLDPHTLWPHEVALDRIYSFWIIVAIVILLVIFINMMLIYLGWVFAVWEY